LHAILADSPTTASSNHIRPAGAAAGGRPGDFAQLNQARIRRAIVLAASTFRGASVTPAAALNNTGHDKSSGHRYRDYYQVAASRPCSINSLSNSL